MTTAAIFNLQSACSLFMFGLVHGGSQLSAMDVPAHIGAAMPVMTILGPSWMVAIVVIFCVLIKHPNKQ